MSIYKFIIAIFTAVMRQLPKSDLCLHWQLNSFLICHSKAERTYQLFPKFLAPVNVQKLLHKPRAGSLSCTVTLMKIQRLLSQNNMSKCLFMGNCTVKHTRNKGDSEKCYQEAWPNPDTAAVGSIWTGFSCRLGHVVSTQRSKHTNCSAHLHSAALHTNTAWLQQRRQARTGTLKQGPTVCTWSGERGLSRERGSVSPYVQTHGCMVAPEVLVCQLLWPGHSMLYRPPRKHHVILFHENLVHKGKKCIACTQAREELRTRRIKPLPDLPVLARTVGLSCDIMLSS